MTGDWAGMIALRTAIQNDLLPVSCGLERSRSSGIRCGRSCSVVVIQRLTDAVDQIAPRPLQGNGGRQPDPSEFMVRVLVGKRLHGLSNEQAGFQFLDRRSFQRFCAWSMR